MDNLNLIIDVENVNKALQNMNNLASSAQQMNNQFQQQQRVPRLAATMDPGPTQMFMKAQSRFAGALWQMTNNIMSTTEFADEIIKFQRAQRSFLRAMDETQGKKNPLDLSGRLGFNVGARGIIPMMRGGFTMDSILGALGLSEFEPVIGGVMLGLVALGAALVAGAKRGEEFAQSMSQSGGTVAQIVGLASMGISPHQAAFQSASLAQKLSSDPIAIMMSASIGGTGMLPPRPFGPVNEAAILKQHIDLLRQMGQGEEQLRAARALGLEQDLNTINVSKSMQNAQDFMSNFDEMLNTPEAQQSLRDLMAAWNIFLQGLGQFAQIVLIELAPVLKVLLTGLGGILSMLASFIEFIFKNAINPVGGLIAPLFGGKDDGLKDALEKNSATTDENTMEMRAQRGMYGGGERSHGALPAALKGEAYLQALRGNSLQFGAFSL